MSRKSVAGGSSIAKNESKSKMANAHVHLSRNDLFSSDEDLANLGLGHEANTERTLHEIDLNDLTLDNLRQLTDQALYNMLLAEGRNIGPVVATTRPTYERMLWDSKLKSLIGSPTDDNGHLKNGNHKDADLVANPDNAANGFSSDEEELPPPPLVEQQGQGIRRSQRKSETPKRFTPEDHRFDGTKAGRRKSGSAPVSASTSTKRGLSGRNELLKARKDDPVSSIEKSSTTADISFNAPTEEVTKVIGMTKSIKSEEAGSGGWMSVVLFASVIALAGILIYYLFFYKHEMTFIEEGTDKEVETVIKRIKPE